MYHVVKASAGGHARWAGPARARVRPAARGVRPAGRRTARKPALGPNGCPASGLSAPRRTGKTPDSASCGAHSDTLAA
jgi:hypothetical protein